MTSSISHPRMQMKSPWSKASLKAQLPHQKPSLVRAQPPTLSSSRRTSIHCVYSANTKTQSDLETSCAILASQVVSTVRLVPMPNNESSSRNSLAAAAPPPGAAITDFSPPPVHGSQIRVAYQGVPGAYSEAAAGKAFNNFSPFPCDQFEHAFQAVEHWVADRGVLPFENSLGGSIHRNYDLLLRHRLHVVGEVQLPVHHCSLALPGVKKEDLNTVISHPQALAQCESTLTNLGLNITCKSFPDTAAAAEYITKNNLRDTAAIASARAAELYGMEILFHGIQDDSCNVTRFLIFAREPIVPRIDRPFKTSIVFASEKGMSILFKVLSSFAFRDINLLKIETRPQRNGPIRLVNNEDEGTTMMHFEYVFYIDFEASMADVRAQNAIKEVEEFTSFLRVLGSYPIDMTPWTPLIANSSC